MKLLFDLWKTAGIIPDEKVTSPTPFYTVAANTKFEVVEDKRSGELWVIDCSAAPDGDGDDVPSYNAPIRRGTDRDVYRVQGGGTPTMISPTITKVGASDAQNIASELQRMGWLVPSSVVEKAIANTKEAK